MNGLVGPGLVGGSSREKKGTREGKWGETAKIKHYLRGTMETTKYSR